MSKGILEFNLDDLDDRRAHLRATMATNLALCLWDMSNTAHREIEYRLETTKLDLSPFEVKEMIFDKFGEILEKYNINLDELID